MAAAPPTVLPALERILLVALLLLSGVPSTGAFSVGDHRRIISARRRTHHQQHERWASSLFARSVVQDPDGPTPVLDTSELDEIDVNDIPELRDIQRQDELPFPVPHQPWRRGDTAGCEAPIAVQWRRAAEEEIYKAVDLVGGRILDVTWFLTTVLVTIDDEHLPPENIFKDRGPVIQIQTPTAPIFYDPSDPNPEDIWADDDDVLYERETEEESAARLAKLNNMYVPKKEGIDDPDEPHIAHQAGPGDDVPLYSNTESRDEVAALVAEEIALHHVTSQQPIDLDNSVHIDTAKLSTIAHAIIQALEAHEEEWRILQRHELVLCSPNPAPDAVETQKQFDAYRDHYVMVETVDPFESNRTLKGRLVDRNAMDVLINVQGRLVTIPHNFVKMVRVRLPGRRNAEENSVPGDVEMEFDYDEDDDDEVDDDDGEDEARP